MTLLFICTGNLCRSRMAEALMQSHLAERSIPASVSSRGTLAGRRAVPREVEATLRSLGVAIDCLARESQQVSEADIEQADLILGMAREHVRYSVVMNPRSWYRSFTLKELVRRGDRAGGRLFGEGIVDWALRIGAGRKRSELVGASLLDDIADPIGLTPAAYASVGKELMHLTWDLTDLLWPDLGIPGQAGTG